MGTYIYIGRILHSSTISVGLAQARPKNPSLQPSIASGKKSSPIYKVSFPKPYKHIIMYEETTLPNYS